MGSGRRGRRVPQRTCVGCRTVQPKRNLIRVVHTPGGRVVVDPSGKASGRGAYLCARRECWKEALAKGRLEYALRARIAAEERKALEEFGQSLAQEVGEQAPAGTPPGEVNI